MRQEIIYGLILLIVCMLAGNFLIIKAAIDEGEIQYQIKFENEVNTFFSRINSLILQLQTIGFFYEETGDYNFISFDSLGSTVMDLRSNFQAIQLKDNETVTIKVYPLKGNEMTLGKSLKNREEVYDATQKAIKEKITTINKPFDLVQGGLGTAIRVPIFVDERFLGMVIGIINIEDEIIKSFKELSSENVYFEAQYDNQIFYTLNKASTFYKKLELDNQILDTRYKFIIKIPITSFITKSSLLINIFIWNFSIILIIYLFIKDKRNQDKVKHQMKDVINELKRLDEEKDQFISIVAHELKSPLTTIKGLSELLYKIDAFDVGKKAHRYLKTIDENTQRIKMLVHDLIDSTRIKLGKLSINIKKTELKEIERQIKKNMSVQVERAGLKFELKVPKGEVYADQDRLLQVIQNLVRNSIKHTKKGTVSFVVEMGNKNARFHIIDTGIGISKENLKLIFKKFYQVKDGYKKQTSGSGLGLSIAKGLVELMNGTIRVKSEVGKGSIFEFTLPAV